jgi:hypothetical protein
MDADISVPPKEVFDSLAALRAVRNFASCHQNTAALRAMPGACSAEQKPAEGGGRDSEGEPSSANSDNVTVQRLSPLR